MAEYNPLRNTAEDGPLAEIIGRIEEQRTLAGLRESPDAEFLAIYGRRRVGKTFLIHETFKNERNYFELTGVRGASLKEQLANFTRAFDRCFSPGFSSTPPSTWHGAFEQLRSVLEGRDGAGRTVIFLDELPWLASRRSRFLPALEHFWNTWASRDPRVLLIVCGSAASWMLDKVLHDRGGLHNRITRRMRLLPFTLAEAEAYLRSRRVRLDRKQVLELYMVMGGVPHYLRQVEPGRSAGQNVDRICFTKDGLLVDEFDELYSSLFDRPEPYVEIVRLLARRRIGLTRTELLQQSGLRSGGNVTKILDTLEQAGFIASYVPFGRRSREAVYRLVDEYSLFYLTWISRAPRPGVTGGTADYWLHVRQQRPWQAWSGYSFEGICLKHIHQLKDGLGIRAVGTTESSWRALPNEHDERGAQIDLLVDRQDRCINLCEMKYSDREFVITKRYAEELRNKRDTFRDRTRTSKTIMLVMVTTHGTRRNAYRDELIADQLDMDHLFR
jgi:uncharacterized protein